jgi:hypothetical protein
MLNLVEYISHLPYLEGKTSCVLLLVQFCSLIIYSHIVFNLTCPRPNMSPTLYSNPAGVIASVVILEVIAVLFVVLRFRSRVQKRQEYIPSDWLILVALVFSTALTVMEIYGMQVTLYLTRSS